MYKISSRKNQSRIDRVILKDVAPDESPVSDDDRRKFLNDKLHALEMQILALPKKHPDRKPLGRQKFLLQTQISSLRRGPKSRPQLASCFMDAAKRLLSADEFTKLMEEAKHIHDIRHKAEIARGMSQQELILERHLAAIEAQGGA